MKSIAERIDEISNDLVLSPNWPARSELIQRLRAIASDAEVSEDVAKMVKHLRGYSWTYEHLIADAIEAQAAKLRTAEMLRDEACKGHAEAEDRAALRR